MTVWLVLLVAWLAFVPLLALAVGALMRAGRGPERSAVAHLGIPARDLGPVERVLTEESAPPAAPRAA